MCHFPTLFEAKLATLFDQLGYRLTSRSAIQKLKCWRHLSLCECGSSRSAPWRIVRVEFAANLELNILKSLRLADSYERILLTVQNRSLIVNATKKRPAIWIQNCRSYVASIL